LNSVRNEFAGRRWLSIVLRSLHLAGVVLAGVGILGNGTQSAAGIVLMMLTGCALYGMELWRHPRCWREIAGLLTPVKLITLLVMMLVPELTMPLFWLLLVASSVVSHAPYEFRHIKVLG